MESITLELRPRLQTCNAFIKLQKCVDTKDVGINLSEESIILTVEDNTIHFLINFVKLIPASLSALNIINNWICFRVQTKSESVFGSFKTEIVKNSAPKNTFLKSSSPNNEVLKESPCMILCTCCKNIISKKALFKRVLPLPDSDYDPNEWFCCKHSHKNISTNLSPQESDLFYGSFFFVLHKSLFNTNVKVDKDILVCNRCLQCLGKVHTNDSFKLWNCCVDYNSLGNSVIKTATNPLSDFFIAIKSSITGIFGEEIILQSFMEKEAHHLTIKPMDWNLNLMKEPKTISDGNIISLLKMSVVKVLYKYETNESHMDTDFTSTKYCEVGLSIIEAGLKHLLLSTKRFPQLYRVASDYYVGHIHIEERKNDM